ncbi:sugar O-acetyltransferase, partial [Moraxella catarrhalis]
AYIRIGAHTLIAPNVQIYTPHHPLDYRLRREGREYAYPVTVGADCWIGGSTVICPGVTIGDRCVIGAGSVVTQDIPDDSFAVGNPCRVIRRLT